MSITRIYCRNSECAFFTAADYPCILHQFKCLADNKCISDIKKCDGREDCSDGADEKDCGKCAVQCNNSSCNFPNIN